MNFFILNVVFDNYKLFAKNKLNFYDEQAKVPAIEEDVTEETASGFTEL